jgi:hypothetical protein
MSQQTEELTKMFIRKNRTSKLDWPVITDKKDYNWIMDNSKLPWLKVNVSLPTKQILTEIKQCNDFFVDHRDEYGEHYGWKSFCIHGKSRTDTQHIVDTRPFKWIDEVVERMPKTVEFFKQCPGLDYARLRVMLLEPGGFVSLHSDPSPTSKRFQAVNIAITQPIGCEFVMKDWGVVPFTVGSSFLLDIRNYHAVYNDSNEPRYHIIVHTTNHTNEFKQSVEESYLKSYK